MILHVLYSTLATGIVQSVWGGTQYTVFMSVFMRE